MRRGRIKHRLATEAATEAAAADADEVETSTATAAPRGSGAEKDNKREYLDLPRLSV